MSEENKRKKMKIGSFLLVIFLFLYIPSFFHWIYGKNITTDILRIGILEESVNADALLVRDEVLLDPSVFDGKFIPEITEGEKVPAFCPIATVLSKGSENLVKELEDVNLKITQAQNDRAKKADFFSEDINKINVIIGQKVQDIIAVCNENSFTDVKKLRNDVDKLIEKKTTIIGENSSDSFTSSLKQQKDALQKRINSNTGQVISKYSGIISYVIDGYEQVLRPKAIKALTPAVIEGAKVSNTGGDTGENFARANKPFVKVIRGNELYMAAVLDSDKAGHFKAGNEIGLRISDTGREYKAVVSYISDTTGDKNVITVVTDRGLDELSAMRKINVDLIINSEEGLKVPLKCLRNVDKNGKKADIMLIKANCAAKRTVDILCMDNESAIIRTPEGEVKKTVNLYDTYILNPDNIKEGDIIDK